MPSSDIKTTKSHAAADKRRCEKCGKRLLPTEFYMNKLWYGNQQRDSWCRDCAAKMTTREEACRYFWENHRAWSELAWQSALSKARGKLSKDNSYINATHEQRQYLEERYAVPELLAIMGSAKYYGYHDPGSKLFEEAWDEGEFEPAVVEDKKPKRKGEKIYSSKFFGSYTQEELDYLNDFYESLGVEDEEEDSGFDVDMFKKLSIYALIANRLLEDYRNGKCDLKSATDATAAYNNLAKNLNITALQKKAKTNFRTSWSEWSKGLAAKEIYAPVVEWPQDDIDKTLAEYKHIVSSTQGVSLDGDENDS